MPAGLGTQSLSDKQQQGSGPGSAPQSKSSPTAGGAHPLAMMSPLHGLFGNIGSERNPLTTVHTNDKSHPAQKDAQGKQPLQSPAWVEAHRKELGMPPDMPAEQFFQEFVAHDLAYKEATKQVANDGKDPSKGTHSESNYSEYEQAMLKAWGYKATPQELQDKQSGLYAARFDPLKEGKGPDGKPLNPLVAFRGTHDLGGARADADTYIGASQYEPHKADIAKLMDPSHGKVTTTGHSLGGALAQKAAADNLNSVGGITTFQSPGIDSTDANRLNAANKDGHIDVAHHFIQSDTVHRAGDERADGKFYQNRIQGLDGALSAPGVALANAMPSHRGYMYYNDGEGNLRDPNSKWAKQGVSSNLTTAEFDHDPVGSRHMHEGIRQGLGAVVSGGIGIANGIGDLGTGIKNGIVDTASGFGSAAQKTGQGLAAAGQQGLHGAQTAAHGLAQGGSEIAHGNISQGLGDAGRGLASGTREVLSGGAQAAGSLWHGAVGGVQAVGQGALDVGRGAVHAGADLAHAGGAAAYQLGKSAIHLAQTPAELGSWAGGKIVDGAHATGQALSNGAHATGQALSNGAHWAGGQVAGAWHSLTGR